MDLSEAIRESFPGVHSVSLMEDANGDRLAVVILADDTIDRGELVEAIVRRGADVGLTIHPVVYNEKEWSSLKGSTSDARWNATLVGDAGAIAAALDIHRERGQQPKRLGRALVDIT